MNTTCSSKLPSEGALNSVASDTADNLVPQSMQFGNDPARHAAARYLSQSWACSKAVSGRHSFVQAAVSAAGPQILKGIRESSRRGSG